MKWHEVTDFVPSKIIVNMVHCASMFFGSNDLSLTGLQRNVEF